MPAKISLSLLEYERDLVKHLDQIPRSESFLKIIKLIDSRRLYSIQIDVMRPPFIQERFAFPIPLIRKIYETFRERIALEMHLMVENPIHLIGELNAFIESEDRPNTSIAIHREAYGSEQQTINALKKIGGMGYRIAIALDLPTPVASLTDEMIEAADTILMMSVPMGKGAQQYDERADEKIKSIAIRFPEKQIEVDGGINERTARDAMDAGARILVVGSFVTKSSDPLGSLERLQNTLAIRWGA